jgi:hypothetical protein
MRLTQFITAHSIGPLCSEVTDTDCVLLKFECDTGLEDGGGLWFADTVRPVIGLRNIAGFRSPSQYSKHVGYVPGSSCTRYEYIDS